VDQWQVLAGGKLMGLSQVQLREQMEGNGSGQGPDS
jgi:hypothetical protein